MSGRVDKAAGRTSYVRAVNTANHPGSSPGLPLRRRAFLGSGILAGGTLAFPAVVHGLLRAEFGFAISHQLPKASAELNAVTTLSRRCMDVLNRRVEFYLMPPIPGGEPVYLKRIGMNQIQGAYLTGHGLGLIDPATRAQQSVPLLARKPADVDDVLDRIRGTLEKRLAAKGYVSVFWGGGGWLRWFSVHPVTRPGELGSMKLGVDATDSVALEAARSFGQVVAVESAGVGAALQSGRIDAALVSTAMALGSGVAKVARSMLDVKWAPVVQALVVSVKSWERMPVDVRNRVLKIGDNVGAEVRANRWAEDLASIKQMNDQVGLAVVTPTAEVAAEWDRLGVEVRAKLRGGAVPEAVLDELTAPAGAPAAVK